jgi:hypothetical protein
MSVPVLVPAHAAEPEPIPVPVIVAVAYPRMEPDGEEVVGAAAHVRVRVLDLIADRLLLLLEL